jgi:hypothetical protein
MWHRVPLDKNYAKALKQVDGLLQHWSKFLVHKSKQRLTKITQFFMRTRKLLKEKRPKIVTLPARQVQREARRESKAHVAAQLENSIEKELLERLKGGHVRLAPLALAREVRRAHRARQGVEEKGRQAAAHRGGVRGGGRDHRAAEDERLGADIDFLAKKYSDGIERARATRTIFARLARIRPRPFDADPRV